MILANMCVLYKFYRNCLHGRPCCWVRVVSKLGPSFLRLGSDSSRVRKIPRVRVGLGPSFPATYYKLTCEPSAQVSEKSLAGIFLRP